ncbi:MAG: GNAT family N-acetyltransferase [Eubacteriales bacterium]|nr:GNAT family N-acetyltransferase [Eubacteriales bacterium]
MAQTEYPLKDGRTLVISRPQKGDAAEMIEYLKRVGGETDYLLMDENGIPGLTVEAEARFLEQNLTLTAGGVFCVHIGGELAATFSIEPHPRERMKHIARLGITVLKKYWHIGAGSAIMQFILDFSRETNTLKSLWLEVRADNVRAIALYERFGFRTLGSYTNAVCVNGAYFDQLAMERLL